MFLLLFLGGDECHKFSQGEAVAVRASSFFVYSESCIQYNLKKMYANIK